MKIAVMKYGEALYQENRIFSNVKADNMIPMSFCYYVIQTEDKNILVDVGCFGKEHYSMYAYIDPVELLKEYGLDVDDITDVLVTHAHFDHVQIINLYKNAVIHVQKDEYERGKDYFAGMTNIHLFEDEYRLDENILIKKYGGHAKGSCIVYVDKYVLCGDECYFIRNLEEEIPTGNSFCPEKSKAFVKEFKNSEFIPLMFHDAAILNGRVGFEYILK